MRAISYNTDNVIITLLPHTENSAIVRTVYSGIFSHIQGHSTIFSHVQTYWKILRHVEAHSGIIEAHAAIIRHIQNSAQPLHIQPCHITMTYLEPWASGNTCQTFTTIMHIQSPSIVSRVYSSIFKGINLKGIHIQQCHTTLGYLEPGASWKACQICKTGMHIQSPSIVRTVYSSIFKGI